VRGSGFLLILLEPVLHESLSVGGAGLAFDIWCLSLVVGQFASDVGFLGTGRGFWHRELLYVGIGVRGLDWWHLVVLELAKVELLHKVGWARVSIRRDGQKGV
jgi:hypothetical protein